MINKKNKKVLSSFDHNNPSLKKYLVNYDFKTTNFSKSLKESFIPCVLLKIPQKNLYTLKEIITITDSIEERKEQLSELFGGKSGLYLEVTSSSLINEYEKDIMEIERVGVNSYSIVKTPEYMEYQDLKKIKSDRS